MTPQENQALQDFLTQLTQVRGIPKDPQAEQLIAKAVSQQPDAAYLLVQRSMLLDQALNTAKAQISQLQNDLQASRSSGTNSFLDSGNAWGRSAGNPATDASRPAVAPPAQSRMPMPGSPQGARPGFLSGGGGNFLGTLAATAAGVAGGAFLFQGIENLMSHHGDTEQSSAASGTPAEPANLSNEPTAEADPAAADNSDVGNFDDSFGGGDEGLV